MDIILNCGNRQIFAAEREKPVENINTCNILEELRLQYGEMDCALDFSDPLETLVATILSAQCTDAQVNKVTPALFKKYRTAKDYALAPVEEIEGYIKSCGFYHAKAKNIKEACRIVHEEHGGEVPDDRDALQRLPGVGRKVASVVLAFAFGQPAIAVDTHVFRVSRRLGLASAKTPEAVEQELMRIIPQNLWSSAHLWLIWHGRLVCKAQRPDCTGCRLAQYCPKTGL